MRRMIEPSRGVSKAFTRVDEDGIPELIQSVEIIPRGKVDEFHYYRYKQFKIKLFDGLGLTVRMDADALTYSSNGLHWDHITPLEFQIIEEMVDEFYFSDASIQGTKGKLDGRRETIHISPLT